VGNDEKILGTRIAICMHAYIIVGF
jgi:hypothetical protein